MKNGVLLLVFSVFGIGPLSAAESMSPETAVPASTPGDPAGSVPVAPITAPTFTATVTDLDRKGEWIRVRDSEGRTKEYRLDSQTEVWREGSLSRLSDVKAGDPVSFQVDPAGRIMTSLHISPLAN